MTLVVHVGLVELAFGAMLGWLVAGQLMFPDLFTRAGVREPKRILQTHLDYVLMGIILIAVGLAVPTLPTWLVVVIVIGTWANPALFVPLAFGSRVARRAWYQVVSILSFVATSGGLVGAAVVGLSA